MTPAEKTLENQYLCLVKNVHVYRSRRHIWISSVVALGFPGLVSLSVPVNGIPGSVSSMFPGLVSLGSTISAPS